MLQSPGRPARRQSNKREVETHVGTQPSSRRLGSVHRLGPVLHRVGPEVGGRRRRPRRSLFPRRLPRISRSHAATAARGCFRRPRPGPQMKDVALPQPPWRRLVNPYLPVEVLGPEAMDRIHEASLAILERFGLEILNDEALAILTGAGAEVDPRTRRVRMDRGLVLAQVAKAPRQFTLHARNPAHDIVIGGDHVNFCMTAGPPNCADLDRGRRPGNLADAIGLLKLAQSLNAVHCLSGMPVAPIDLPVPIRHLEGHYLHVTLTDKVWAPSAIGSERVLDAVEIYRLSRGLDDDGVRREPGLSSVINTNSPLRVDGAMLDGLMAMARWRQCVIVTPFTLAGAMSPVTIAGD